MTRIAMWGMTTVVAVGLLFGYRTSTDPSAGSGAAPALVSEPATTGGLGSSGSGSAAPGNAGSSAGSTGAPSPSSSSGTSSGTSTGAASSGPIPASVNGTFTGTSASTRWGPVQVAITVQGGRITAAKAVEYPTANGKDVQINSRAVPAYQQETVQAQSASIDHLSGATVTWQGYTASLQSAIDQAATA